MYSEKNHPDKQLLSVTRESGVIVRNTDSKEENHNYIPDDLSGYKLVRIGDFAINKMKSWQGSYGVSKFEGIVSPAYYVCNLNFPYKDFFSNAIRCKAYIPFFTQYSKGIRVDQWDLSPIALKNIPFFEPPLPEQEAIVTYLDTKVAKIDEYISIAEKKIAALEELKQTIIAEAVTRGIHKDVPMKDSGVKWIGMIPEHWKIEPFGRHFSYGKGLPITKADLVSEGVAVISYGQIHSKLNIGTTMDDCLLRYVDPKYIETNPQCLLNKNDFVFADTSEDIEGCGNFAFNDRNESIFAGYHTIIVRPIDILHPKYYAYLFQSKKWKSQVQTLVNGVKVFSISRGILKKASLLIPTYTEQQEIVTYLDSKVANINQLCQAERSQIEKLKEYKQRLISDVVTGKVKVTND